MTITKLHNLLGRLIENKRGRVHVSIDKKSFQHVLDEVTIHDVASCELIWVPLCDDDGGLAVTSKGGERGSWQLVLFGDIREPLIKTNAHRFRPSDDEGEWCANCHYKRSAHHGPGLLCKPPQNEGEQRAGEQ